MTTDLAPKRPFLKRASTRLVLLLALVAAAAVMFWPSAPAAPPPRGSGVPMKAIVYYEYGPADVLRYEDIEKLLPNDNQVLIKVRAAGANPLDWHYMRGRPYLVRVVESAFLKPKNNRLGTDMSGVVEAVGKDVTQYKPGDEVFGGANGAFAEYVVANERNIALKPADLTFEQAAAVPVAALTALQALRDSGKLKAGQKVLINGASGGVGTYAVQIAKSFGADVTGVCSTRNVEMVKSLGADHVIDYTKENFTEGAQQYDLILDNVSNHSISDIRRVLRPDGTYVLVGGAGGPDEDPWLGPMIGALKLIIISPFVSQNLAMMLASINKADLNVLKDLADAKKLISVIDRTYPLSETPAAMRYLESGRARGKVVIVVDAGHTETVPIVTEAP